MRHKMLTWTIVLAVAVSCSDDDEKPYQCTECAQTPEAAAANDNSGKGIYKIITSADRSISAANDNSGKGIYKGLVVGSSGTIKFNIANSGSTIDAVLILDDVTIPLQTTATYDIANGFEGYFTNSTNGVSIGFYVTADGLDYGVFEIEIDGHADVMIAVVKELSTALAKVFEGTYSGDGNGTFNMLVRDSEWGALVDEGYFFSGAVDENGQLSCDSDDCEFVTVTGKIISDTASGNWSSNFDDDSGKWKANRTL
jgi:hypothetical protein